MRAFTRVQPAPSQPGVSFDTLAHLLVVLRLEYGRAIAAERRYQKLRHSNASTARTRVTSADLPRHVFDEFYARPSDESTWTF
jgi:hypothetical protein